MRLRTIDIERMRDAGARSSHWPMKLSSGQKCPHLTILLKEEPSRDGPHAHVNAGRQLMSNTDTRVSIIVGVRQHDPERWGEFDSIYRPMLVAYLRKRGLKESEAEDIVQGRRGA